MVKLYPEVHIIYFYSKDGPECLSSLRGDRELKCQTYRTVSVIGLEFFSSLELGFRGALHLQSTVELLNGDE